MSTPTLSKPLCFNRVLKETVWGGRFLAGWLGEEPPFKGPLGESWELSDVDGFETVVADGEFAGYTLHQLLQDHSRAILGSARPSCVGNRFPLLVKFLEAEEDLSVQVHPSSEMLRGGFSPKSECWYFLKTSPGAEVMCGLSPGVTRDQFANAIHTSSMPDLLESHRVHSHSFLMVEAGQVHAIRSGIVLCEIQQTSDCTFRLHDWNRLGLDGSPRDLHVEEGLDAIDFQSPAPSLIQPEFTSLQQKTSSGEFGTWESSLLTTANFFQVTAFMGKGFCDFGAFDKPRVITVIEGSGSLSFEGGARDLCRGSTVLIPAACPGYTLIGDPNMIFLEAIPE